MSNSSPASRRPPRIIFNDDGAAGIYECEKPCPPEALVRRCRELRGTAVDVLSFCVGDNEASNYLLDPPFASPLYEDVAEWVGGPDGKWQGIADSIRRGSDNLVDLHARGVDHFQLNIDQARSQGMGFFAAVRMNDRHEDDEIRIWYGRSRYKRENPHLLIGGPFAPRNTSNHTNYCWAFDYAQQEVRDRFHEIIEYACSHYDVDGVELDFGKSPLVFKQGERFKNVETMNGFLRRVRTTVRDISASKGKDITVMARVPGTLGGALEAGFDSATWIREELIDILVPMSCSYLHSENDIRGHVELARAMSVLIYCGLELNTYGHGPGSRIGMLRAVAANALHDGAAGIYVFNYAGHRAQKDPLKYTDEEFQALCELHDAEALSRREKIFFITPDPGWMPDGDLPRQLPRLIGCTGRFSDERQSCRLRICDDPDAGDAELRVMLRGAVDNCLDRLFCLINGTRVELTRFRQFDDPMAGGPGESFHALADPPLIRGDNRICILMDGIEAPDPWPEWVLCDVAVRYN